MSDRRRAYHGREKPRASACGVAASAMFERTREAFGCCKGRFGSYLDNRPVIARNANITGVGSRTRKIGIP
jgi:hypothetical protein